MPQSEVSCSFRTGEAGTGKTFSVKAEIQENPAWGKLCSTTGISAVNLDTSTINSILRYFDTASLQDANITGALPRRLHELSKEHRNLVIDEISMMDAAQLDILYRAMQEANGYGNGSEPPMGIVAVGDFAQLPPVKAKWAFKAECWGEFAKHTTRLTKVWRQDQPEFLAILNAVRRGDGAKAVELLGDKVEWHTALDVEFDGTTIIPKNDAVDRFNQTALDRVPGKRYYVFSRRWGKQRGEWKNIPGSLTVRQGCYVMILSNDKEWKYVNGDCGHIEEFDGEEFTIRLVRNDSLVFVPKLIRNVDHKDRPATMSLDDTPTGVEGFLTRCHRNLKRRWVEGQVEYYPLRLAYASTVHKSQGLSLDKIQVDFRHNFFGSPSMLYVALSRCRSLEGLRLVGQPEVFIKRSNSDPEITPWL